MSKTLSVFRLATVVCRAFVLASCMIGLSLGETDYYSSPGLHQYKSPSKYLNEAVDPFSGTLSLRHTDIVLPGNGGMDIRVSRFTQSKKDYPEAHPGGKSMYGIGWFMHFGRVIFSDKYRDRLCNQSAWAVTLGDNPILEHPDGSREILQLSVKGRNELVTKSNWRAKCVANEPGITLYAPNGTQYKANVLEALDVGIKYANTSWFISEIVDVNKNAIKINYGRNKKGYLYIEDVRGGRMSNKSFKGDGRIVSYNYKENIGELDCFKLKSISTGGSEWQYRYEEIDSSDNWSLHSCAYNLTEVILPSGKSWKYTYNGENYSNPGKFAINQVEYPDGGKINYKWQHVNFSYIDTRKWTVLQEKTVSDKDVDPLTWTYDFRPGGGIADITTDIPEITGFEGVDITTITTPFGTEDIAHQGVRGTVNGKVWSAGLELLRITRNKSGAVLKVAQKTWTKRLVSKENNIGQRATTGNIVAFDKNSYAPILESEAVTGKGGHTTQFSRFDIYGNPKEIRHTPNRHGYEDKVEKLTYYNNKKKWIIGKVKTKKTVNGSSLVNTYDNRGRLTKKVVNGTKTTYKYSKSRGDLVSITNALGQSTYYSDYYRGVAKDERNDLGSIDKDVDYFGRVTRHKNRNSAVFSYTYDLMGRLIGIDYPLGSSATIDWGLDTTIYKRGSYEEERVFNGFGETSSLIKNDLISGALEIVNFEYDGLGRKTFQSIVSSSLTEKKGTNFFYDNLGRVVKETYADNSLKTYEYSENGSNQKLTDQNGYIFETNYANFGAGNLPIHIAGPEGSCAIIEYNILGQVKRTINGATIGDNSCKGNERSYTYNKKWQLISETSPELGKIDYTRDVLGREITKTIGGNLVSTLAYDRVGRLINTEYGDSTSAVERTYDNLSNLLLISNGSAETSYQYDKNNNLLEQKSTIGDNEYLTKFEYDQNDYLERIIYPSGRTIDYQRDGLGRPISAKPFVTSVAYHPSGEISEMLFSNGQKTIITIDKLQRTKTLMVKKLSEIANQWYEYDERSNLIKIDDNINSTRDKSLTYDGLNRLSGVIGYNDLAYFYNEQGDITGKNVSTTGLNYDYLGGKLSSFTDERGRTHEYQYDELGNITRDSYYETIGQTRQEINKYYNFNLASQLTSVQSTKQSASDSSAQPLHQRHTYLYDGHGMRIKKESGITQQDYVYSSSGNLLGEYDAAKSIEYGKEYFYLGSSLISSANFYNSYDPNVPTEGDDELEGDSKANEIDGGGGSDSIMGLGGNDLLKGGEGGDFIDGGIGSDQLFGDQGSDIIIGGSGGDNITGGSGNDRLNGGLDADHYYYNVGDGVDIIFDTGNEDVIHFGEGLYFEDMEVAHQGQVGSIPEADTPITLLRFGKTASLLMIRGDVHKLVFGNGDVVYWDQVLDGAEGFTVGRAAHDMPVLEAKDSVPSHLIALVDGFIYPHHIEPNTRWKTRGWLSSRSYGLRGDTRQNIMIAAPNQDTTFTSSAVNFATPLSGVNDPDIMWGGGRGNTYEVDDVNDIVVDLDLHEVVNGYRECMKKCVDTVLSYADLPKLPAGIERLIVMTPLYPDGIEVKPRHGIGNELDNVLIYPNSITAADPGKLEGGIGNDLYAASSRTQIIEQPNEGIDTVVIHDKGIFYSSSYKNIEGIKAKADGSTLIGDENNNILMGSRYNHTIRLHSNPNTSDWWQAHRHDAYERDDPTLSWFQRYIDYPEYWKETGYKFVKNKTYEPTHFYGGDGDDTIYSAQGSDFIDGGKGDDIIFYGDGKDVITYKLGDGNDILDPEDISFNWTGSFSDLYRLTGATVELAEDITSDMFSFSKSGNNYIVGIGEGSLTLKPHGRLGRTDVIIKYYDNGKVRSFGGGAIRQVVESGNSSPTSTHDNFEGEVGSPLILTFDQLLENDYDLQNDELTVADIGEFSFGIEVVLDKVNKTVTISPPSPNGQVFFRYNIEDAQGLRNYIYAEVTLNFR